MVNQTSDNPAHYHGEAVDAFLKDLTEATRPGPYRPEQYVQPVRGDLAIADYHHVIFGQRGSGKSSLLRDLESKIEATGRVSIWMDQEVFKKNTYPNVLVSSVLETLQGLRAKTPTTLEGQVRWWNKVLRTQPKPCNNPLAQRMDQLLENLRVLKQSPDDRQVSWTHTRGTASETEAIGTVSYGPIDASAKGSSSLEEGVTRTETITTTKEQYLEHALTDLRDVVTRSSSPHGGGFVILDDFYHLNREDQPEVLGYMHRLLKDTGMWIKVGTLRNMTTTYKPSPPTGMQIGHDAKPIQLDRQFQRYEETERFLLEILRGIARKSEVRVEILFTEGALRRLVLASGGVARDYLDLAGTAIEKARNRGISAKTGTDRVIVEDVNAAAAEIAPSKLDDIRLDAPDDARELESFLSELTEFCRNTGAAYFLVDTQNDDIATKMKSLESLRFANLIEANETVPDRRSRRFDIWLLDLAMLAYRRAAQVDFEGWRKREMRRQRKLIFDGASMGAAGAMASVSGRGSEASRSGDPQLPFTDDDSSPR